MEPSINKSGIFAPDFSERDTAMTNNRLKGFTYGAVAAASYGMNPLFALPLYGAGMSVDSVLFYRYFFAVVMLGILMKVKKQSFALKKADILPLAVMGLLFSFSSFFLFESYNYMDAGIASTILFVYPVLWANVLSLALFPTIISLVLMTLSIHLIGSTPAAILGALEPVTALFFGVVVFGEQLTPRIMLGILMILTAVTLIIAAKPLLQLVRRRIG